MATSIEVAVIELQILMREFNRRLAGLETRLGLQAEPFTPRADRVGGPPVHRPLSPMAKSERVAEAPSDPYDFAAPPRAVPPMPEPVADSPKTEAGKEEILFATGDAAPVEPAPADL